MNRKVGVIMSRDCFVSGTLSLALRVSRLAGLAPLRFTSRRTGWSVCLSRPLAIYGYILITIINLMTLAALIIDYNIDQTMSVRMRTNTRRIVWIADAGLMMLTATITLYKAPGNMMSMINCINIVQKINFQMQVYHWPMFGERKKFSWFLGLFTTTVVITIIDHVVIAMGVKTTINIEISINTLYSLYYVCYWILQLQQLLFILITLHILYTFKAINDSLRNLLHCNSSKTSHRGHKKIRKLALIYASACDMVREMDRRYGAILLLVLAAHLLHLVVSPYYLINNLFQQMGPNNKILHLINVVLQTIWCAYHTVNLIMVIEPCHMTHLQMQSTRDLVIQLTQCTHSLYDPVAMELELFFRHLILNQVSYSPLRVTTLSRSLIVTIFGSITTYLVVITQL